MKFLISRTDNIGDVLLTLPLCGMIKEKFGAGVQVFFLGKTYTEPVVQRSEFVDGFLNWDVLKKLTEAQLQIVLEGYQFTHILHVFPNKLLSVSAKNAKIPVRIGTLRRWFHWFTCSNLPNVSRKKSQLHESQLNAELLCRVFDWKIPNLLELQQWGKLKIQTLSLIGSESFEQKLPEQLKVKGALRKLVLLHPKSFGSAREWGLENFKKLAGELAHRGYLVGVTGSQKEREYICKNWVFDSENIFCLAGLFSLSEFINLIENSAGLVAASTGPLHIASACGVNALGLYPPMRPIHPERWKPIGEKASVLVEERICNACEKSQNCACLRNISVEEVARKIEGWN